VTAERRVPEPPPRPRTEGETGFERQGMVSWLSPRFLAGAGLEVFVSGAFSKLLDKRELAAGLPGYGEDPHPDDEPPLPPYTDAAYRDSDGALWLDYAADVGEGFDPTYSVAWLLAKEELEVGPRVLTRRGRALVLGGDQVYPSANWQAYRDRFAGPYRAALPYLPADEVPHLYAIPGNHDWYDGLTSFTRLFTQRSWIGAWRTRQRRSYFALRLSERWWLWATDIQFDTYLDGPQLDYFRRASRDLEAGHRVILATAKPSWVRARRERNPAFKNEGAWQTLAFVEEKLIGESEGELAVTLTGDHHFYARYEKTAGAGPAHRITAGGGGAHTMGTSSLPPTIRPPSITNAGEFAEYELRATSPTPAESRSLRDRGLVRSVMRVSGLGWLIGAAYALVALAFSDAVKDHAADLTAPDGAYGLAELLWDGGSTWSIGLALLLAFAFVGWADVKHDRPRKVAIGLLHWLIPLALVLACPVALILAFESSGIAGHGMLLGWVAALAALGVGWLAGRLVLALYLLVMNRARPTWHLGEVWGALGSSEFKNFLRLKIDRDERLTVYPVGIRRAARWRIEPSGTPSEPWFAPDGEAPTPHLIEDPIVVEPDP
jgi:hypothetical protein